VGHFAPEAPDFNLAVPDQIRVDIFMKHLAGWLADKQQGKDTMPNFVMLRLATITRRARGPRADAEVFSGRHDLAVGRAVEALRTRLSGTILRSSFSRTMLRTRRPRGRASQPGGDRKQIRAEDCERRAFCGQPLLLDCERGSHHGDAARPAAMNNNDAFASLISTLFTGRRSAGLYRGLFESRQRLIYTANKKTAVARRRA